MRKKLFNIFLLTILSGCTVIGSQPILSFDSIDSDNIVIFLQDSKNAILILKSPFYKIFYVFSISQKSVKIC